MSDKVKVMAAAGTAITTINVVSNLYRQYAEYRDKNRYFYVRIQDDMFVYPELMDFLNAGGTEGKAFRLKVDKEDANVRRFYDSPDESRVHIKGFPLFVSVRQFDPVSDDDNMFTSNLTPPRGLEFRTETEAAVCALEGFIEELTRKKMLQTRPPSLYGPQGNYWNSSRLPRRDIDSLMLRAGYKENLLADVDRFLDSEERYLKIGVPWHRGYLLHGPPGNGKSSIVMSLANHYNRNLYALSPNAVKDDNTLNSLLRDIDENSILLIEDIDIFSSAVQRDKDTDKGPTLAGLLNGLDGVYTPHGLVTFITTNRIETLDEALIRPGRIDYRLHLEAPEAEQITRSFQHVYGEPLRATPRAFGSMAEFIGVIKRYQDDPAAARAEIAALDRALAVG